MSDERGIWLADVAQRENLATFVERILRLDEAAVVRLRARGDGVIVAWAATGFEVLAARVVMGRVAPTDLCAGADALSHELPGAGRIDPGFAMDSAWRGALPPENGFSHLDDVPARTALELSQRGVELAREHSGPQGPPPSLLDQDVLTVSAGDVEVGIPMRCVFALTAMGFVPEPVPEDEVIRVRVHPTWLRIDARFGSVYRRRSGPILLSP
ncbi:hypothetical protein FZI85_19190 [Mycobacterium sp. CBMA293]|uniref:hypothetical protein n=1 Tax=unclassified Mycolicibacterium TaxID=2636767 RepID=UPI0012DD3386|nr:MULTISPECIES: hypothetical protein [unclassified Mycolicibacterium]MUL48693.1 hypothetical protein [Mycolicibacterium sp. CBMA 360]MUL60809.1 hypothetical protein [Mycolicibacterium sp. CBMA 335]MUL71822.1 hypothetical protein [Mycolicibacterium sp. CBMA 311]MUL95750.1 hypothetical protein [Mycolicibacterium sp. CBMA 230]MUM03508.1 hypothetical protein [Mycolicibacterium sp. CBMA 213]